MKMLPLYQFVCDTCSEIIKQPSDGYLEWVFDNDRKQISGFRIVHVPSSSPLGDTDGCFLPKPHGTRLSRALEGVLASPLPFLLAKLDGVGMKRSHDPFVADMHEFTELFRRLTIPHYEEARSLWSHAEEDGFFSEIQPEQAWSQENLLAIIAKYGKKN